MAGAEVQIDIDLSGFDLADQMVRNAVLASIRDTALKVDGDAKRKVPVDTGRLKTSIHPEFGPGKGPIGEPLPTEFDAVVGTNVEYAAAHEYGFTGDVTVQSHTRKQTVAWGRPIEPRTVAVRTHARKMNVKKRPYLTPAYHKNRNYLRNRISARLRKL